MRGGDISAMYMGETTEARPTPTPPMIRKALNSIMFEGNDEPIAPTPYIKAVQTRVFFLPILSASAAPKKGPQMHPIVALLTANPTSSGVRWNWLLRKITAPETMDMSNPNRRPPTAATAEIKY